MELHTMAKAAKSMGELFGWLETDKPSIAPKQTGHWTDLRKSKEPKKYKGKVLRTTPTYPPLDGEHVKRLRGAPTDYREAHNDAVLAAMSEGYSLSGFAGYLGVTRQSIDAWCDANPKFAEACARAKSARLHWWETQALEIARTGGQGSQATMVIFGLKNMGSDEWKEKQELAITGTVTLASMVESSLRALEARTIDAQSIDVTPSEPDKEGNPT